MVSQRMLQLGTARSVIRELFEYGRQRAAEVGAENVFDFSLGNPSVPAPVEVNETAIRLLREQADTIHCYTSAPGDPAARQRIADSLNRRFGEQYTADELYLTAGRPLPGEEYYEEFAQLENGVGMITSLVSEFNREMAFLDEDIAEFRAAREAAGLPPHRCISVCTGVAAYPTIRSLAARLEAETEGLEIHVYEIINHFFGETITVAGLLTGKDMAEQLTGQQLGEELLIPENTLRADEAMFLDDMTPDQLSATLGVPVTPARNDGSSLVRQMLGIE